VGGFCFCVGSASFFSLCPEECGRSLPGIWMTFLFPFKVTRFRGPSFGAPQASVFPSSSSTWMRAFFSTEPYISLTFLVGGTCLSGSFLRRSFPSHFFFPRPTPAEPCLCLSGCAPVTDGLFCSVPLSEFRYPISFLTILGDSGYVVLFQGCSIPIGADRFFFSFFFFCVLLEEGSCLVFSIFLN